MGRAVEKLKLGLMGLPDAEMRLVATLFRLHQVESSFIWALTAQAPFDAVLADGKVQEDTVRAMAGAAVPIKWLHNPGELVPDQLARPLRSDLLINWLKSVELVVLHGAGDAFASTALQSSDGTSSGAGGVARGVVAPASTASAKKELTSDWFAWGERLSSTRTQVRLLRWPSPEALGRNVERIRMATMISRRPMAVDEVASLARVSVESAHEFLVSLGRMGFIECETGQSPGDALLADGSEREERAPKVSARKSLIGFSLIRSIRQRFGI